MHGDDINAVDDGCSSKKLFVPAESVSKNGFIANDNQVKLGKDTQSPDTPPDEHILGNLATGKVNRECESGGIQSFTGSDRTGLPGQSLPYLTTSLFL